MVSQQPVTLARAIEIAVEHHRASRLSEAENVYRQVLNADPDNFDALHLLGVVAQQLGRHAESVELIRRALSRNPSSARALSNLGETYRAQNDLGQARISFEKALSLQPDFAEAHNGLGVVLQAQGELEAALSSFRKAISLRPDWAGAQYNLGLTLMQLGDTPVAARAFHAAWTRDPMLFGAAEHCVAAHAVLARDDVTSAAMPAPTAPELPPEFVSIVFCSIDDERHARTEAMYRRVFAGQPHEIISIRDARSLSEAYNRAIEQSVGEIILLSHDDVDILARDFAARLQGDLRQFDAVGVIGATQMNGPGWAWSGHPHLRGWITHHAPDEKAWSVDVVDPRPIAGDIMVLDGVLLAARRDVFAAVPFDAETFDGFHLYDIDWSYRAAMAGFRLGVAGDLLVVHASRGRFDPVWQRYAERFCAKHATGETSAAPHRQVFEANLDDAEQVRAFYARLAGQSDERPTVR